MSVTVDLLSRPTSGRGDFADKHAVTQVEKWMAIIREISQEQLSSDLSTSAEIDERTRALLALTDQIIEANRTKRESTQPKAKETGQRGGDRRHCPSSSLNGNCF